MFALGLYLNLTTTHSPFSLVRTFQLVLGEDMSKLPCLADLYNRIKANTKLCERLEPLPVALQVNTLFSFRFRSTIL